jgi:hypothetical protein
MRHRVVWRAVFDPSEDRITFFFECLASQEDGLMLQTMELRFLNTSVPVSHSELRRVTGDLNLQQHCCDSLKTRTGNVNLNAVISVYYKNLGAIYRVDEPPLQGATCPC